MAGPTQKSGPNLRVVSSSPEPTGLGAKEAALVDAMLDGLFERNVGARGFDPRSVKEDLNRVRDFINFCGKPPWEWTEDDFDQWAFYLGVEKAPKPLARSSQRKYHAAIKKFLDYVVGNARFTQEVRAEFCGSLRQIVTAGNSQPHVNENESAREKFAMSHDEVVVFFDVLDGMIEEASKYGTRSTKPLQRAKAMYYFMYVTSARAGETVALNENTSFAKNEDFLQFGEFGQVIVFGKGSKGSGKKQRTIVIDHPDLPPILQWYVDEIRPWFLRKADPNEQAMWVSSRGRRLSQGMVNATFNKICDKAGFEHRRYTPHSLRRTSVTHGRMNTTVEVQQRKAGHAYPATTEGYTAFSDEYIRDQIGETIQTLLDELE